MLQPCVRVLPLRWEAMSTGLAAIVSALFLLCILYRLLGVPMDT